MPASRSSSRSASESTSCGGSAFLIRSHSSLISGLSPSLSPSSSWIALSCCRRKWSRWALDSSLPTCSWIFVESSSTASCRERYCPSRSSRVRTLISPSRLCFSSIVNGRLEASRSASRPGSRVLIAATCSSSGICWLWSTIRWKKRLTWCTRASSSTPSSTTSSYGSTSPTRYGSVWTTLSSRARYCPWQTIRVEPSGNLSIFRTMPTQTIGNRSSIPGASFSGCNWLTRATIRSPIIASSISRMPLGRLITSGTTVCGNTTSDRNGNSGSLQIPIACPSEWSPSTMICPASTTARPMAPDSSRPNSGLRTRFGLFDRLRLEFMRGFSEVLRG